MTSVPQLLGMVCIAVLAAPQMAAATTPPGALRVLHIEAPKDVDEAPMVRVGSASGSPTFDPSTGTWVVPVAVPGPSFVTTYAVTSNDAAIVAVKLEIPARILEDNPPLVYLPAPSVSVADDKTVRHLYESNDIDHAVSDSRVQFRYLQDLIFINSEIMKWNKGKPDTRSMSIKAAFLLHKVVRNLARNAYYVTDRRTKVVIDYAVENLKAGFAKERACGALKYRGCSNAELSNLIDTVRYAKGAQLVEMYRNIVPDGAQLGVKTCRGSTTQDMRDFLSLLGSAGGGKDATGKTITDIRVASELTTCELNLALCLDHSPEAAIKSLESTDELLRGYPNRKLDDIKQNVTNALTDLRKGKPARCPDPSWSPPS